MYTEYAELHVRGNRIRRQQRRAKLFRRRMLLLLVLAITGLIGFHAFSHTNLRSHFAWLSNLSFETNELDSDTFEQLRGLVSQEPRVQNVLDHYQEYPVDILKMLAKNLDMLDFVLGYPEKKGEVFADTIGDVEIGRIPLLLQYDTRWGYGDYGSSTVVVSGCGPTCLAMVIAGLTGENTVTPYTVAQYANAEGYYVPGSGTSWTLMSEGATCFGVSGKELPLSQSVMEHALGEGKPIICSVRPGDFTTSGHFIVITGIKDGQFVVNDPNSVERSNQLWDYETLEPQISNLWAFQTI